MLAKILCTIEDIKLMMLCQKEGAAVFFAVVVACVVDDATVFLKVVVVVEVRFFVPGLFLPNTFDDG